MKKLYTPNEIQRMKRDKKICAEYLKAKDKYPEVSNNRLMILLGTKSGLSKETIGNILRKNGLVVRRNVSLLEKLFYETKKISQSTECND